MEYTINKIAQLSGISTRTLRYYDDFGLLVPSRMSSNGYRIYGQKEIDKLQHILFYRELGFPLEEIKQIISNDNFDINNALHGHLSALIAKRSQLDILIANVEKTMLSTKGEVKMNNKEKFKGFGHQLVEENEAKYGEEIRKSYGDDVVEASHDKIKGMTKEQYAEIEALSAEVNEALKIAFEQGDPASELAQKACELHQAWLSYFWAHYTKEAHIGLAEMYIADERFTAYYDKIASGCTEFLRDAIVIYCS